LGILLTTLGAHFSYIFNTVLAMMLINVVSLLFEKRGALPLFSKQNRYKTRELHCDHDYQTFFSAIN
jgi:hypothetical protein